jgi:hypothetical protein
MPHGHLFVRMVHKTASLSSTPPGDTVRLPSSQQHTPLLLSATGRQSKCHFTDNNRVHSVGVGWFNQTASDCRRTRLKTQMEQHDQIKRATYSTCFTRTYTEESTMSTNRIMYNARSDIHLCDDWYAPTSVPTSDPRTRTSDSQNKKLFVL